MLNQLRFYCKRIIFIIKLNRICDKKRYKIIKNSPILLFKGRRLKFKCDFYIKTEKELLSVKLFGTFQKRKILVFFEERYCFRVYGRYRQSSTGQVAFTDTIKRKTPTIDWKYRLDFDNNLPIRKILLLNPAPFRVETSSEYYNGMGIEYCDTDKIFDFYIYGGQAFIKSLDKGFNFENSDRIFSER